MVNTADNRKLTIRRESPIRVGVDNAFPQVEQNGIIRRCERGQQGMCRLAIRQFLPAIARVLGITEASFTIGVFFADSVDQSPT